MKRKYEIWLILSISCLFVLLPFAGYGAGLVIGNDVTVNGDLFVTAQTPFWGHASGTFSNNFVNKLLTIASIPAGQRLVIEHVAVRCEADTDDSFPEVTISVTKKTGPTSYSTYSVPVLARMQGTTYDGKANWVVSQSVRLYSDGGSSDNIIINIFHSKIASTPSCYAHVSGYTVTTP